MIAEGVRHYRTKLGLSAQQVANQCEAAGYPIPRSVIANLESGRRESVSIAEWLVLSMVLEIPPLLLLYPVGRTVHNIEALPGVEMTPWDAVQLAESGQGRDKTIRLYREHDNCIALWRRAGDVIRKYESLLAYPNPPTTMDEIRRDKVIQEQNRRQLLRTLNYIRTRIRHIDLIPPDLPVALQHLDDEPAVETDAELLDFPQ